MATIGLLAGPSGAFASLDFGKVRGWWPLNEGRGQTVYDWSSYRNHGMLGSTPSADANDPAWIKGIFWGSGLNFSGDDFVQIPDSDALEPQKFTISLWTRAPQSPGQFKYLLAKGSNQCVAASYGIWIGEPPGSSTPISYNQPDGTTSIGGYRGSCDLLFNGDIDQVMIFDKVLPIEQIWTRWGFILNKPTFE